MKERLSVKLRTVVLVLASIFLVTSALAWQIQTIETGRSIGTYCSIAVDDSSHAQISYRSGNNFSLRYARWTGTDWSIESADTGGVGGWTSIALDEAGYPHISYHDGLRDDLKYTRWTGSGWETERIDTSPGVGDYSSIAIDDSGRPHIAYHAFSGRNLKYAFFTGTEWLVETVDSPGWVGIYCALALQFGTTPYISYMDGDSFDLKLAWQSGGGWEFERVDTLSRVGWYTSVAIGSNGYPQIAYHGLDFNGLRVARWDGSGWAKETIDAGAKVRRWKSIALDSHGYAHISYYDENLDALNHAYWDGSSWHTEVIDGQGVRTGDYNSIAVDRENNVHVAYCSWLDTLYIDSDLRYAKRGPTTGVETGLAGRRFQYRLFQNSPNPFSHWTKIRFQLAKPGAVSIKVYDIAGRQVKVLTSGKAKAGSHHVTWDGTDAADHRLPSGVYFTQMKSGDYTAVKKLLLVR